ncbi:Glutaredoxin-like protein [Sea otter poxvirus]|uniref:Glutaredoxin-2 n=1 Tax=Sea otter poxvirus TaxID=1416741 RepID=A0A2U9QHM0_9POXV|nr:Glutaredoxin-like protein [Sea otter poxvirus]AWU47098.1 Glutaredoxin-like protein [Sea otter poxvirus]
MTETLILIGKPLCSVCEMASELLKKIEGNYNVLRVNIMSLFSKDGAVSVLGMGIYGLITALTEYFGNDYVLLLKYSPERKECAYVPFKQFIVVAQIDKDAIDYKELSRVIEDSKYGEWPPLKK